MVLSPAVAVTFRIASGLIIWAVHFMASFAFTTLACARGLASARWLGVGLVPWVLGALTVVALAATVAVFASALRSRGDGFVGEVSAGVAALAAVAIVWEALPIIMVAPCA